jgi:hypothetical protein
MGTDGGFASFLLLTVALLALAVVTGFAARRRWHIGFVVSTLLSLAVTVWYALRLGELYDLESAGIITPIHLTLAKVTTLSYLLPIATGLRTLRSPAVRPWHRRLALLAVGLTVASLVTGSLMVLLAEPL